MEGCVEDFGGREVEVLGWWVGGFLDCEFDVAWCWGVGGGEGGGGGRGYGEAAGFGDGGDEGVEPLAGEELGGVSIVMLVVFWGLV